ncbi:uncharacterized protein LOC124162002 [Ischnura elegans]|uniref:uncharacterized protein LOC124162002 n=1 Tax=Ischnura elegans TaxID=197161 RepID=UPI001ED89035|nr:uncharacterized protein LOC124162002 [Ischnura elegans]
MAVANVKMVPLNVFLFCFFGALACLIPFLPLHMRSAGLSVDEARIVSMVAPAVSLLGPLAVGPLIDRITSGLWGHSGTKGGKDSDFKDYGGRTRSHRRLRALLAVLLVLGAVAYCLLLLVVPVVSRRDARTPRVAFKCSAYPPASGGVIVQERCGDQCHDWGGQRGGSLVLRDCRYDCDEEDEYESSLLEGKSMTTAMTTEDAIELTTAMTTSPPYVPPLEADEGGEEDEEEEEEGGVGEYESSEGTEPASDKPTAAALHGSPTHLCFSDVDQERPTANCHAFHSPSNSLAINATLDGSFVELERMCVYPISSFRLDDKVFSQLSCRPSAVDRCHVLCSIHQPYDEINSGPSLLGPSGSCPSLLGDPRLTFWSYLIVRSVADCFPAASLAVLDAGLLLPSPHSSPGRHLTSGALGIAIASPLAAVFLSIQQQPDDGALSAFNYMPYPWPPFVAFSLLVLVAVVLLLTPQVSILLGEETGGEAKGSLVALGDPPCTRKPRPRLGPYPPSHLRTHLCEAVALLLVLILLGMFWGGLDSFSSWYLSDMMALGGEIDSQNMTNESLSAEEAVFDGWFPSPHPLSSLLMLVGVIMTVAALPAIPLLWHIEKIIEICGHANLLIIAFTLYIVRYAVFSFVDDGWWVLISEAIGAPVAVGLAWATSVHYAHLLFPPRFSGMAQAAAVMAHFCIGRCLGSVIGAFVWGGSSLKVFLQGGALMSALVASLYFLIYHLFLKARCIGGGSSSRSGGPNAKGPAWAGPGPEAGQEGPTTNGNYTPLRVYHNGKGDDRKSRY